MFTLENEYYIRFILLLVKGGTEVLRKVVIKGLQNRNVKLETFLEEKRSTICSSNLISKTQQDILYPPSPHSTDISKWDIALLSFIILEYFKPSFTASDISSVEKLRDMQNMVSTHQADAAIDGRKFTTIWSDLSVTITILCHALNLNDDEKDYVLNLVSSIASDDLDMNEAVKELEMLKDTSEFLKGITNLENLGYLESAKQSQTPALETSISALNEDDSGHLTEKMDRVQLTGTDESNDVIDDDATETTVKDSDTSNSDTEDEKRIAEGPVPALLALKGKKKKRKKHKRKHKKDTDAKRLKVQTETDKENGFVNTLGQSEREDGFEIFQPITSNPDTSLNPEKHSGIVFGMGKPTKTQQSENQSEMGTTHQSSLFKVEIKHDKTLETKNNKDKNRTSNSQGESAQTGAPSEAQALKKLNNDAQYTASQATKSDQDGTDVDGNYNSKMGTRSKKKTPAEKPDTKTNGNIITTDSEEMVKVHFHVLISPDFNFDSNTDKVVIRLKNSDDRPPYRHHMEFVRELTSRYTEMTYSLEVPKTRITGESSLNYKYFVVKSSPHKQGKQAKNGHWEHYYVKGHTGASFNRNLKVPQERIDSKKSTLWHQFDGIVNKKCSNGIFMNWIYDHVLRNQKLQHDAKMAMQVFGEQIIQPVLCADLSASSAILNEGEMIETLIHGLWKTYVNDGECFKSKDELKKELGKYLFDPVLNVFTRLSKCQTQETDKQWKWRLIVQLTLLTIWKEMKLDNNKCMTISQQLCKSFLISHSTDKKTCKEFEFIKQTFPTKIQFFKESLVTLGKVTTEQSKDPSWLYTMPLIHFLSGECDPFDKVSQNTRHDGAVPTWWGTLHKVQDTVAKFKAHQHRRWEIPLQEVIQTLQPFFDVDFLLPRTIMACLDVSEVFEVISTRMIPVEICCATLFYFLKTKAYSGFFGGDGDGNVISKCMETLVEQLTQGDNGSSNRELCQCWFLPTKISLDLLQQALQIKRNDIARNSIRVFLICASNYVRLNEHRPAEQYSRQKVMKDIETVYQKTRMWLNVNYSHWYTNLRESIMVWNECMVPGDMILQDLEESWNISLSDDLAGKLASFIQDQRDNTEKIVKLYCKTVDSYNPFMQNCLHETAIKAIDGAYNIDVGSFNQYQRGRYGTLLSTMFHAEWSKIMQNVSDVNDRNFLRQILEWSPFLRFMKILVVQKQSHLLDEVCEGNLMITLAIVQSLVESLLKGSLTIGDLQIMHEYAETFADIASLVKMDDEQNEITKEMILVGIKIRKKELDMFLSRAELIVSLAFLCKPLTRVEMSTFEEVLIKQATIESHTLNEFCQPVKIDCVENIGDDFLPELIVFRLPASIDAILQNMHLCRKSSVFFKMWKTQCENCNKDCTSLDDILKVWKPVYERLEKVLREIESGKILFCQFEELLGSNCGEDYEQIENELRILQIKQDIIETRVEQLKKYRYLETCKSGAQSLLRLKSECNLEGDFEQIELIADDARENIEMEQFDDSLMDACEFLKDFSRSRAACLNTFLNCQPLVQWLKESMHTSGLKELQVFVDLASMSIGDNPYNIGKVQALHSAVTGYAPLIFDLREDCGFKELLDLCKLVWRELKANPKLPKQLEDTNSQIEWLTEIKNAHGVVEVTSMMQTEAINTNGTFIIGRQALQDKEESNTLHDYLMSVADTVKLIVPGELGKRKKRNYTFSELQDLHSRLMLVAGKADKGTESVERFTMIFDSITRLGKVFVKLHTSGCVLFKDWSARFICDPDPARPVCATITFGQGDEVQQLKGRRTVNEDLKDMIPKIARFMELCHDEWLQHINDKRWTHTHLNYFTVDQLVILQRELVKFGTDDKPSHLIYPLLSAVKKGCTEDDIQQAILSAKNVIGWEDEIETDDDKEMDTPGLEKNEDIVEDERKMTFIRNLVDAGQEEAVAIKALAHVDDLDDFNQGILWCIEHGDSDMSDEDDMSEGENTTAKSDLQRSFEGWSKSEVSMQSIINANLSCLGQHSNIGVEPLIHDLQQLWNRFLTSISSNIRDYLSIEHLGIILQQLAFSDLEMIDRSLPPGIKESIPNLLVCPKDDVLVTALSVYMMDKGQPLPQSDEILMCTSKTTIQEVDIFWRRALFGGGKKIHCLLHADYLEYEVSEVSERLLKDYLLELGHKADVSYRLCVICGQENEYRSTMVSFLDKYRTQAPPVNKEKLKVDIADRLAVHNSDYAFKPAAFVDSDRSTVRIIKSWRAGVGKTLFKSKKSKELLSLNDDSVSTDIVTIPLQEKHVDIHYVIERLLNHTSMPGDQAVKLFHIDISHEVQEGIDYLLFNLLILGCLVDKTGYVWRKLDTDLYLIETMPIMTPVAEKQELGYHCIHPMLAFLPDITCRSPQESLEIYKGEMLQDHQKTDQLFDADEFLSEKYQRPFQYLLRLTKKTNLENVHPDHPEGNQRTCLEILLRYCGIQDPSWSELHHFVWFLNTQLVDFKENDFVSGAAADVLPGFSTFVLRFLIQMSKDFSTRSLYISEESPGLSHCQHEVMETDDEETDDIVKLYQMRRTWESSPHPYLFFNWDRLTFTFLGFNIQKASGNLIDQQTGNVLEESIMQSNLYEALERNHVPLQEHFNLIPREEKLKKLRGVMGKPSSEDPDDTYELTTDNVRKILAIYMRFRCDIPVIIMGETGCGKTRLVKFLCGLQIPKGEDITNMVLMKVHGGTTSKDIIQKVRKAEALAKSNMEKYGKHMYTVLFFDEANSTQAIGLIKEIMCDKSMEGEKLQICVNLKIVAACNPYRKHTEELIKKLEQAGLGYHVDADETIDRLGRVPMRRLVYRVQPLPQSLLPLVWDFGQLNTQVEDLYIQQMVKRHIVAEELPDITGLKEAISAILTASQDYMRQQKDECSFVSLRDVERVLTVMSWFYKQSQNERLLYNLMDEKLNIQVDTDEDSDTDDDVIEEETDVQTPHRVDDITRSLILALGVCYHACLKTREQYRDYIASYFQQPCKLPGGGQQIFNEIDCCQDVFLDQVDLAKNIARNMALKENVFMMVVCIELRIPLFLIGKPGSSKSLAKTIVSDAMRGNAAKRELFRGMKQAQMASFQCSPLSTPDGIVGTFKQCARFQRDKNLDTFVSVVVLDEVGLAEDSPRMPLKTLHPLLEDGCHGEEKPDEYEEVLNADTEDEEHEQYQMALHPRPEDGLLQEDKPKKYKKVAFIGISNWALDPAKMNRGIVVQREVPDIEELINSARGICSTDEEILSQMEHLIQPMAVSYLELFNTASEKTREFFGLRDFYSLVKMVFSFVEQSKKAPTWHQMLHAIKRNFEGLDQVDPVESFKKHLSKVLHVESRPRQDDPDCSAAGLIRACLFDTNNLQSESRYMLLLTENYGALAIIQQLIFGGSDVIRPITIFGSSFRSDQEYTQVCLNINKIKVCMETGNTVVLLNLENLYESLYDALNQYYVFFGDVRYVDLGLGTHRVKCPVHPDFRLIVIAEKDTVYKKFPIPLINRLEKHFLTINTMLTEKQRLLASKLEQWARDFSSQNQSFRMNREQTKETKVGDVFIGFHEDSCSAIILYVWQKYSTGQELCEEKLFQEAKFVLLWCATPDAIVRLEKSSLPVSEQEMLFRNYFNEQAHSSIVEYISYMLIHPNTKQFYSQVTTHSKLLTSVHIDAIGLASGIDADKILLLETLSSFDTEQQFTTKIRQHMKITDNSAKLIVIQCDSGDVNANLIACARYCVMDEFEKLRDEMTEPVHVVLIVQLPKVSGGCFTGFQCGKWHSAHIDDLQPEDMHIPSLEEMHGKSVGMLIDDAVTSQTEPMETDDSSTGEAMEWKNNTDTCTRNFLNSGQEDLKLDDVLSEFENVGNNVKRRMELYKNKLDVKKLVLSCVQSALSMVKDKAERSNRETERVDLVIRLLHQDPVEGQSSFLQGICVLIARLLQQKERKVGTAYNATHWLVNEAATLENTSKTGTFRSSCIKVLESKVSPILAGIIAYCDTNGNLSILQETQYPWKQQLWLDILNTPGIINLQYKEFQSPIKLNDLNEVTVFSSGCEGRAFYARMPFSWLFIDKICEVLKLDRTSREKLDPWEARNIRIEACRRVLSEHPLFKFYEDIRNERIILEGIREYTCDLIRTLYPAGPNEEFDVVFDSITAMTETLQDGMPASSLLNSVIFIHLAFEALSSRLTSFHMLNVAWPECSEAIIKLKAENPDHFLFKENEITFTGVYLLIESIAPGKDTLESGGGRSEWLGKVHRYRSVVEKVISLYSEDPTLYGANVAQIVRKIKMLWSRVTVMKLFIEHVCVSDEENRTSVKHYTSLWSLLGDEADMKTKGSFIAVEKFLKACNKKVMKDCFRSVDKCSDCEKVLEGAPITLPCQHVLCDRCYNDLRAAQTNKCAKCQNKFVDGWVPGNTDENGSEERLKDYQKRCNAFFMDVISQLSFADKTAPSDEVVEKLLSYAFCRTRGNRQYTKDLSIFNTGIDPNPVLRSFLLQLLLKTSEKQVLNSLRIYLDEMEALFDKNTVDRDDIYLLVIHCLEDKLLQAACADDAGLDGYAIKTLQFAAKSLEKEDLIENLYGLASARMGLAVVADCIAKIVRQDLVPSSIETLLETAKHLCEKTKSDWPLTYLVKYLCRCYGIDVYQAACSSQVFGLRWIAIMDMNEVVSDRYIICGEVYTELREAVSSALLEGNIDILQRSILKCEGNDVGAEIMLQLAIYRVVTVSHLSPQVQRKFAPEMLLTLSEFIKESDTLKHKELSLRLIENRMIPNGLVSAEGEDLRLQGIKSLIVHFHTVLTQLKGERTLLQPLMSLIEEPQNCSDFFLPTMRQDELEDVKEALRAQQAIVKGSEKLMFYRCPNRHAYVIGDCGRPYVKSKCHCGAEIGGEGHKLLDTNTADTATDQTMTGHILGAADARGPGPKAERLMTPAACATVRLLIHMAMYLGVGSDTKGIQELIKPDIETDQVEEFLWRHIQLDVNDIQRAITRSVDDVLLFMHCIINGITKNHDSENIVQEDLYLLSSKRGRQEWETAFVSRFLKCHFLNMDDILHESNHKIVNDKRLGADPLLCMLYETDNQMMSPSALQDSPRVWRYRTPVSLQHLRQRLEAETGSAEIPQSKFKILQHFLAEEYHLRALRCVPSILRLQRLLLQKYHKKIDKAEASHITVAQLKKDDVSGSDRAQLIADLSEAWELSRNELRFYSCTTEAGYATIPDGFCEHGINDDTPLSMLLPTTGGVGLCSFALLDFLMRKQNDFLDKYIKETERNSDHISKVSPKEVTSAHLISYDALHDLLPLILANCKYTFKMGEGTSIEYDFAGLERHLMDRFLFSKSKIDVGVVLPINKMVYRTESTNAEVFKMLAEYIEQESLNASVKTQICEELRSLPDICQSLYDLDITISFLKTTGGLPSQNLHEYMRNTLQMERTVASQKAQQMCRLKHVKSLWMLLAFQKSKTMIDNQQQREYAFESVQHVFDVDLTNDHLENFNHYMKDLSVDKLSLLVEVLHELILLKVAVEQNTDDPDYTDIAGKQMKDWLLAYIDEKEDHPLDTALLLEFPEDIKLEHSIHTWVVAYRMLKGKQTGAYSKY